MAEKIAEHQSRQTEDRKRINRLETPQALTEDFAPVEEVFPSAEILLTPGTGRPDPLPRPSSSMAYSHDQIISLQQTCGNSYVQQWLAPAIVQAKLTTQQAGDNYEREADRIAAEVGTDPDSHGTGIAVSQLEKPPLPEDIDEDNSAPGSLETRIDASREAGQPMHESVRRSFQGRMGHDFSGVRIHSDIESDTLSHELGAEAFTTGEDIFFRTGNYQPHTKGGRELLAHELAHIAQQNSGEPSGDGIVLQLFRSGSAGGAMFSEGPEDIIGIRMSYQIDNLETILSTIDEVVASGFGASRDYSANPAFQSAIRAYLESIGHASVTGGGPRMSRERWLHFHIRLVRGEANRIQNIQFIAPDRPRTEAEEGEGFSSEFIPEEVSAPVEEEEAAPAPVEVETTAPRRELTEGQRHASEAAGVMDTVGYWASARWLWDPILESIGGWEHELDEAGEHIRREPVLGEILLPFVSVLFVILQAIVGTLDLLARLNPLNVAARIGSIATRGISGVNTGEELLEELSPLGQEGLNLLTLGIGTAAAHLREAYEEMNIFRFIQGVSEVIMAVLAILGIRSAAGALRARLSGAPRVAGAAPTEAVAAEARVATPEARVATPEARVATREAMPAELAETGFEQSIPPELTERAVAEAAPELAETGVVEAAPVEPIETARTGVVEAAPVEPIETARTGAVEAAPVESLETARTGAVEATPAEPLETARTGAVEATPAEPLETARTGAVEATPAEPLETARTGAAETPGTAEAVAETARRATPVEPIESLEGVRRFEPATELEPGGPRIEYTIDTDATAQMLRDQVMRGERPGRVAQGSHEWVQGEWEAMGGRGEAPPAWWQEDGALRIDRDRCGYADFDVQRAYAERIADEVNTRAAAERQAIESGDTGVIEPAEPAAPVESATSTTPGYPLREPAGARPGAVEVTPAEPGGPGGTLEGYAPGRAPAPLESIEGVRRFEPATELEPGGPRIEYTIDTEATAQMLRDQVMRGERPGRVAQGSHEWVQGEWEAMGGRGEAPPAWWQEDGALRIDRERCGYPDFDVQRAYAERVAQQAQEVEAANTRRQLQEAAERRARGEQEPAEEGSRSPAEVGINYEIVDVEQARHLLEQYRSEGRPVNPKSNRSMGRAYEEYGGEPDSAPVAFVSGSGVLVINMQAINPVGAAP